MAENMVSDTEEDFYNDLRDEPCIVCGDPYAHVLGSYSPNQTRPSKKKKDRVPVLYYTLCEKCFNNGRIPTARIEAAYRNKFSKIAA